VDRFEGVAETLFLGWYGGTVQKDARATRDEEKLAQGEKAPDRDIWNMAEKGAWGVFPHSGSRYQTHCCEVQERWRPRCGKRGQLRHGLSTVGAASTSRSRIVSRAAYARNKQPPIHVVRMISLVLGVSEDVRIDVGAFVRCLPREKGGSRPGALPTCFGNSHLVTGRRKGYSSIPCW
jgi:hypothetical protein